MMRASVPSALLATLLLSACALEGISSNIEPETGPGAVYSLVQVNGLNVPAMVSQGQQVLEVTRGALTLSADSSWILSYVLRSRGGGSDGVSTQTSRGRYVVTGATIAMRLSADTSVRFRGAYSSTDVAVVDQSVPNGDQFAFRR